MTFHACSSSGCCWTMLSKRANLTVWLHGTLPVRAEMSDCSVTSAVTQWFFWPDSHHCVTPGDVCVFWGNCLPVCQILITESDVWWQLPKCSLVESFTHQRLPVSCSASFCTGWEDSRWAPQLQACKDSLHNVTSRIDQKDNQSSAAATFQQQNVVYILASKPGSSPARSTRISNKSFAAFFWIRLQHLQS